MSDLKPAGADAPPRTYKTFVECNYEIMEHFSMVEIEAESIWDAAQNRVIMLNQEVDAGALPKSAWMNLIVVGPSLFADADGNREEICGTYIIVPRDCQMGDDTPGAQDDEAKQLGIITLEDVYEHIPGVTMKTFPE